MGNTNEDHESLSRTALGVNQFHSRDRVLSFAFFFSFGEHGWYFYAAPIVLLSFHPLESALFDSVVENTMLYRKASSLRSILFLLLPGMPSSLSHARLPSWRTYSGVTILFARWGMVQTLHNGIIDRLDFAASGDSNVHK